MKRKFEAQITATIIIEVDDAVIDTVDDQWRKDFYDLRTPEQVVDHLVYNKIINKQPFSALDGFANLRDDLFEIKDADWEIDVSAV